MVASILMTRGQWRGAASPLKRDGSWTEKRSRREDDACPMDRRRGGEWHPQATHGSRSVSALSKSQRFGDSRQTSPMGDIRVGLINALIGPRFALLRYP